MTANYGLFILTTNHAIILKIHSKNVVIIDYLKADLMNKEKAGSTNRDLYLNSE